MNNRIQPDPGTNPYGYMIYALWRIIDQANDIQESSEVALTAIIAIAQDALDAAGECGE
jgi:hypothetical protein